MSPAPDAPIDPGLVERFTKALARLNPGGGRIGLAVSGGPDSMAMLLLAHAAIPGRFEVATVNHGLRAEAADECALVAAACAERGVACAVLDVAVAPGNVQAMAREARYADLCAWADVNDLRFVATAHHIDDQAETLLMRLNRGSGVAGLSGVQETYWPLHFDTGVIRPVLHFRRAELQSVVDAAAVPVVRDPSNQDDRYDRVRLRKALADAPWLDPVAVAQAASNLADAYEAVQGYAAHLWDQNVRQQGESFVMAPHHLREMNRRMIARIIEQIGGRPRGGDVARLLSRLEQGQGSNVGGVLATVEGNEWVFRPEPPRRSGKA
ncbi:MAG: tRNA lysidine(34) synthetase TilS [Pseudomonadota bacterium]